MDTNAVSTETTGVMAQIREHLESGRSSSKVIALGYKPPTVYKVQRQLRKQGKVAQNEPRVIGLPALEPPAVMQQEAPPPAPDPDYVFRLEVEIAELQTEVASLREQAEEVESLRSELGLADVLNTLAFSDSDDHQERVKALEQDADEWRRKAEAAEAAIQQTKDEVAYVTRMNQALMPLTVWQWHPCCECGEATDGIVDRKTAARLLGSTGHKECLNQAGRLRVRLADFADDLFGTVDEKAKRATIVADYPRAHSEPVLEIAPG